MLAGAEQTSDPRKGRPFSILTMPSLMRAVSDTVWHKTTVSNDEDALEHYNDGCFLSNIYARIIWP